MLTPLHLIRKVGDSTYALIKLEWVQHNKNTATMFIFYDVIEMVVPTMMQSASEHYVKAIQTKFYVQHGTNQYTTNFAGNTNHIMTIKQATKLFELYNEKPYSRNITFKPLEELMKC
jgi:hypothetical protein